MSADYRGSALASVALSVFLTACGPKQEPAGVDDEAAGAAPVHAAAPTVEAPNGGWQEVRQTSPIDGERVAVRRVDGDEASGIYRETGVFCDQTGDATVMFGNHNVIEASGQSPKAMFATDTCRQGRSIWQIPTGRIKFGETIAPLDCYNNLVRLSSHGNLAVLDTSFKSYEGRPLDKLADALPVIVELATAHGEMVHFEVPKGNPVVENQLRNCGAASLMAAPEVVRGVVTVEECIEIVATDRLDAEYWREPCERPNRTVCEQEAYKEIRVWANDPEYPISLDVGDEVREKCAEQFPTEE